MGVGDSTVNAARDYGMVFVFDTPPTKNPSKTLSLQWYWNWQRVLSPE